jgi:uncharacterized protein YfkK (UPF0435 family)
MNESDFEHLFVDMYDVKQKLAVINDKSIEINDYTYVNIQDLNERVGNLEKKIDEIYRILFNSKRLDLSDLDN